MKTEKILPDNNFSGPEKSADFSRKCEKCGYESCENKKIDQVYLCSICSQFAPDKDKLLKYLEEKIEWKSLETFRKFGKKTTFGMQEKANQGKVMSRAAFGYKIVNKELIIDESQKLIIQEIFRTFLEQDISLNQLAKKHNFSVNGIKKILRNFTYIGKIKFAGQVTQGKHISIISPELFNKVQSKLENLGVK